MAKNKNAQARVPQPRAKTSVADDKEIIEEIQAGIETAAPVPEEIEGATADEEPPSSDTSAQQLRKLWQELNVLYRRNVQWKAELEGTKERLREQDKVLTERQNECREREQRLAAEERALESQRLAAKEGFVAEMRQSTREFSEQVDALLDEVATWGANARSKALASVEAEQAQLEVDREALGALETSLRQREKELRIGEERVRSAEEFLKAREMQVAEDARRRVDEVRIAVQSELEDLRVRLAAHAESDAKRLGEIRELESRLAGFGHDPEELQRRIDSLTKQMSDLQDELSRRPMESEIYDLRMKSQRFDEAEKNALYWQGQHDSIEAQLRVVQIKVAEVELLRDEKDFLESQIAVLKDQLVQKKKDWDDLQKSDAATKAFPACSAYDADEKLNRLVAGRQFETLADLAVEIRNRMATNPETSFYYSEADVRIFLAGLAASRLHLLQGISGTGKTSLPREFFKALAGEQSVQIVEVQAGWRDKDDLFGYFNAFEKTFVETEFTKALYRALLPANADRPMVIVLDEMNLAHPEQYFSVMLSLLESGQDRIPMLPGAIPNLPLPAYFDGASLPLPRNVWFVGTANHDETTVAFADKTYDRSHVQVLPSNYTSFRPKIQGSGGPVSFAALEQAFATAVIDYAGDVAKVKHFLGSFVHPELAKFGVGWGNRLERQIDRFVPVILDSGGSVTEAVDHLIATKLVRKLQNRFGMRPEQLEELADSIELQWDQLESGASPDASLQVLRSEAKNLRGGFSS